MSVKSMYFAHRNPALRERFRPRWRRHAALAMSMPALWDLIERYAQCDPVDDPPAALGVTARYDAIGISWFRSFEAYGKGVRRPVCGPGVVAVRVSRPTGGSFTRTGMAAPG